MYGERMLTEWGPIGGDPRDDQTDDEHGYLTDQREGDGEYKSGRSM